MAADESLELKIKNLEHDISKCQETIRRLTRQETDGRADVVKHESLIHDLSSRLYRMKHRYPVVLLSEYKQAADLLESNRTLLARRRSEVKVASVQLSLATKWLAEAEQRLQKLQSRFNTHAIIIAFRP